MSSKSSNVSTNPVSTNPKKRLIVPLIVGMSLMFGGGGYAAWTLYFSQPADAKTHAADTDSMGLPPEIAAESSFTHSFALGVLIQQKCGSVPTPYLLAASENEIRSDGILANLSWLAAARRADQLSGKSCGHLLAEIAKANDKAAFEAAPVKNAMGH